MIMTDYLGGGDSRNSHSLPTFFVYFLSKIIIDNSCESAAFYQLCYERNERFAERQLNSRNDNWIQLSFCEERERCLLVLDSVTSLLSLHLQHDW